MLGLRSPTEITMACFFQPQCSWNCRLFDTLNPNPNLNPKPKPESGDLMILP